MQLSDMIIIIPYIIYNSLQYKPLFVHFQQPNSKDNLAFHLYYFEKDFLRGLFLFLCLRYIYFVLDTKHTQIELQESLYFRKDVDDRYVQISKKKKKNSILSIHYLIKKKKKKIVDEYSDTIKDNSFPYINKYKSFMKNILKKFQKFLERNNFL